jgi:phage shock protein C
VHRIDSSVTSLSRIHCEALKFGTGNLRRRFMRQCRKCRRKTEAGGIEMQEARKFYRSRTNHIIAGVCGGLAEYYGVDSTLVRAIVAAAVLAGVGVPFYIGLWIFVPYRPTEPNQQ